MLWIFIWILLTLMLKFKVWLLPACVYLSWAGPQWRWIERASGNDCQMLRVVSLLLIQSACHVLRNALGTHAHLAFSAAATQKVRQNWLGGQRGVKVCWALERIYMGWALSVCFAVQGQENCCHWLRFYEFSLKKVIMGHPEPCALHEEDQW